MLIAIQMMPLPEKAQAPKAVRAGSYRAAKGLKATKALDRVEFRGKLEEVLRRSTQVSSKRREELNTNVHKYAVP